MNKIDIFQDKEFMALPQEKQTQVLTNYFDKNMADDDFVSLPQEKQTLIKQNFINSQLNISEQEKKEVPKTVESELKSEETTKNSFLDKVKDFGKTYVDNVADTFVGARPFGTEDKTKEIKDKAFDTVFGGLGGVQEIKEPLNIENQNPKYQELENELKQEIKTDAENQNKKIENNLIQDIENLSRIDTRLIGDATKEEKDKYLNNIAGILGKGGYALGQRDNGDYIAIDKDGNEKEIKNDFFESILDGIKADAGELTGAIYGAKKGFDISKNMKNPVAKVATIAGSSAVGSVTGTALDMGINRLKDRENNLSIEDILNEFSKSAALDLAGNAIGAGVVKVGGKIIELPKQVRDYILNGNLNGAREILKKDLGVDEKYIEDALEQAKSNYKEVKDYAEKGLTDKSKQQEELLATTLEKGDANIIKGAIASNETAARNLADTIDKRTTTIFDELDNKSSKVGGEEIKNYLNNFEQTAKQDFSNMRKDFSDAFKEIDYKFELEDLKLNETFRDMAKRVQDPDAKKRFLTLQSAIKNTIYDSNAQVGIERDISGLLDMRQQLNRFYGQNERYLTNKKDKDTFNSLKENLDNQIYKAVNDNLPPELGTRLIDSFSKSMDGYRQLGSLQENKVFKSIMGEANSPEFRLNNLVKHMADDDSYVDDVLSKMNPNARQTVEVAVIRELADSFTAKTAQGQRAIAFEDLGKQLEGIKRNVRSELGKETIDNLITYADKFGNKDLLYLDMAKGIATKPKHNIATTIEGKVKMETASMVFQFIQSLKPGDDAKRLALQRHIGKALEKTRTPNEFATKLYEYPDLTDESRNILKSMIKNNNKILAAKNDKEAERLLIEAQEKNQKLINDQERLKEEIENFKTPDIYESRVVSRFADDNKFASFAQLVTRIQKGTATQPDIEQYIKLKNSINPDILEKNILKEKYPENAFSIHKLNDLKSFANEKVNEIISEDEFKALIYNLDKHNKLPNTTQEIENKYREKFYQLHKLYEEEKALKEIEKQTVEDTEKKAFEEAEKAGLIPFAKFGDNLLAGTVAGVETDEDGNIVGFDPEMFVAGLGGYTALKTALKNKEIQGALKDYALKIVEYVDMNPAIYKQNGLNAMFVSNKSNDLYKYLKIQNKSTFPKIRVENIFLNKEGYSEVPKDIREIAEKRLNTNSDLSSMDTKKVRIEDIVPTQKNLNFDNLRSIDGLELEKDIDEIIAIEYNGKYYLNDGHHRVASLILKGEKEIEIKIINEITNDSKGFYSVLEKTVDEKVGGKIDSVSLAKVLEKNGVKQDELEWSGLKDLLDSKDKLTKEEIQNTINENRLVLEKVEKIDKAKYKNYKMDGGENYRELLFTSDLKSNGLREIDITIDRINNRQNELKKIAGKAKEIPDEFKDEWKKIWQEKEELIKKRDEFKKIEPYYSQHWEESNIVVFTRVDDRTIDNKKTLFIEELQSDWHQNGRKKGYGKGTKKVPDAPFKKNWHELGLKRMIQEAVENDYEKIAWTTGKQQASRYSLEKEIDTVVYNKQSGYLQASKNGDEVIFKKVASDEEVANLLGKEITNRLIDPKQSTRENIFVLQGEDVKFGGDGMKAFYDEIVPNTAKKLFKKYNVKPKLEELDDLEEMVWSVEITPKMKEDIKKYGQPLYAIGGALAIGNELSNNGDKDE